MATAVSKVSMNIYFDQHSQHFDFLEVNGSKFALFNKQLKSYDCLSIDLKDYNVIFLTPLEAEKNISIKAISVFVLCTLNAKNGKTEINATGRIVFLGGKVTSNLDNEISGKNGTLFIGIIKERLEMILEEFKTGASNKNGQAIVDALMETYAAIDDPEGENEDPNIDMVKAFAFFDIPPRS